LPRAVAATSDLLFAPGGIIGPAAGRPRVTMCRNMLPFDPPERRRYPAPSPERLRLEVLHRLQAASFRRAEGLIFLTHYARNSVIAQIGQPRGRVTVVPHGVAPRFATADRPQDAVGAYDFDKPFRLLYVSTVNAYKHQWTVVEAVARASNAGLPVRLDLAGGGDGASLARLQAALDQYDPDGIAVTYHGVVPFAHVHDLYHAADGFVFASSCENMPNILLEAMSAGLPILCADRGPMPEILGDGGLYFDPEDAASLTPALGTLLSDASRREALTRAARARAAKYSWERCADQTFGFLAEILAEHA